MQGLLGLGLAEGGFRIGVAHRVSVAVDPASIGAVASGDTLVTIPGVQVGDLVIGIPPVTMTAGLALQTCVVTAPNVVTVRLTNASAGAIDGASLLWTFLIFDLTPLV